MAGTWRIGRRCVLARSGIPGWVRQYFYEEGLKANRWAAATRSLYHFGVLALLLGLSALVSPPADAGGFWRWVLFGVALTGALAEAGWIAAQSRALGALHRWSRMRAGPQPVASESVDS